MNNSLKPTYQYLIGELWVLWYEASNNYSIVIPEFKNLLDKYIQSKSRDTFAKQLTIEDPNSNPDIIIENLENYLANCNQKNSEHKEEHINIDTSKRSIYRQYNIKGKIIQIYYDSDLVLKAIHSSIAHHEYEAIEHPDIIFDLYLKDNYLHLYKNDQLISRVPKRNYHLVQGKFIMHLLCIIHNKQEQEWVGTFHGSTITDGSTSILFVGKSGKGKSTLSALLANNGFDLLADDVSPLSSKTSTIYFNPSAISIKEGAINVLKPYIKNFENLSKVVFNKQKGVLRYLPCKIPKNDHYPCKNVIIVNYKKGANTTLKKVSIKTLMEVFITDSWISQQPKHAKEFLDWLQTINAYKLTYSDTKSVIEKINQLF